MLDQTIYEFDPRVRRKAEALVAAGYVVDVLALRSSPAKKRFLMNGVNVYTAPLSKKRASLVRYVYEYVAFFLWAFIRVPLLMLRRRYSVVEVNTLPDFLIFAPIVAKWIGAKLVLDMHEIMPEFYVSKYGIAENSWFVRVLKWLEKSSFEFADHVITITEPIRGLLVSRGLVKSKSTVIVNSADETRFVTSGSTHATDNSTSGKFIMMYHGTLTPIYGLDTAVEAFASVHERMPGAEFWILGFGPEETPLATLIRQHRLDFKIRLIGAVRPADVPDWLNKCDVGILPMRRDIFLDFAFPNKLGEYIVMNKPVIISRLKTLRHYFSAEALAYFDPGNVHDLAQQMVRLYETPALRARLAIAAKAEYAPIRWEVMKQRYLALIQNLCGARHLSMEPTHATETAIAQ